MNRDRRSAFTLLELLIVLVILSVLGAAFLVVSTNVFQNADKTEAQQRINTLSTMIQGYRTLEAEYPRDRLGDGMATNNTNGGAEALFVALFDASYTGEMPDQGWLVNTDDDTSTSQLTRLPTRELFEVGDPWGNPIMYFESLRYDANEGVGVMCIEYGTEIATEQTVSPGMDERTGAYANANGFQLISAGPDGWFGTEDDITNYD